MALARYVLTANVTLTADATVGEPVTGSLATVVSVAGSEGKFGLWPMTLLAGTPVWADSAAGFDSGAKLLFQAIGASNLRAWIDGTDSAGRAALSN